jgi:hypothetical protein
MLIVTVVYSEVMASLIHLRYWVWTAPQQEYSWWTRSHQISLIP